MMMMLLRYYRDITERKVKEKMSTGRLGWEDGDDEAE